MSVSPKKGVLSEDEMHSWSYADLEKDSIPGISIEKAYAFLEGKKGVKIIVAIADSGVDIEHKDLKDVAWIHPEEVAIATIIFTPFFPSKNTYAFSMLIPAIESFSKSA